MQQKKRRFTALDLLAILIIVGVASYVGYRLFLSLNYKWNWTIIPTYLVRFDAERQAWTTNILLEGFFTTLRLSVWGMLVAVLLGGVMGMLRIAKRPVFRLISLSYVELTRNTPPVVLVFIFYYFVSDQILPIFGIEELFRSASPEVQEKLSWIIAKPEMLTVFLSGVLTIGIFQGAYITEIIRAGIQSVPAGQWEASSAQGLSWLQQMRHVIMPQATKVMLPPLGNEFINTIKYSSICSIISIQELTFQGLQVISTTQASIEIWLTISLMYLVVCFSLSLIVSKLEKKVQIAE